jgi:NO-binding membrane sensor protein with MHYT domain
VLSLIVAIQGAYVGLSLAVQIGSAEGLRRRLLLAGAAISLAVAIWAMHFVGMLAARLPFPVDFLVFPTLLSFLVCVIVVGIAVFAISAGPPSALRLTAAAVFMGIGIATMHYIGMTALHASAHLEHRLIFVVASVAVGIAASGLALWLAGGRSGRPPLILSATALGVAIAGMHYTAMSGLTVFPHPPASSGANGEAAISSDLLASIVAIVAFLVSGSFLLALVPDRSSKAAAPPVPVASPPDLAPATTIPPVSAAALLAPDSGGAEPDLGQGSYAPLGGAGGPPRRPARHIPVEQGGATHFLPVEAIIAIHANAHYTTVFDGRSELFCPLSIGEVEQRLDAGRFLRVHRSHIVNLQHIAGLRRAGDNGIIELAGERNYTVPVSRNRFNWLKAQLGLKPAHPAPRQASRA